MPSNPIEFNQYTRAIVGQSTTQAEPCVVHVDVYDVLAAFEVNCPAQAHAIKKLLCPGKRGIKDTVEDLTEAKQSIDRAIALTERPTAIASEAHPPRPGMGV